MNYVRLIYQDKSQKSKSRTFKSVRFFVFLYSIQSKIIQLTTK